MADVAVQEYVLSCLIVPKTLEGIVFKSQIADQKAGDKSNVFSALSPTTFPSLPQPLQTAKLLESVAGILNLDKSNYLAALNSKLNSTSRLTMLHELELQRLFLNNEWIVCPSFKSENQLTLWKARQDQGLLNLMSQFSAGIDAKIPFLTKITKIDASRTCLLIDVLRGNAIMEKDTGKTSNPYCTISHGDLAFVTDIHPRTVNPIFNFKVLLLVDISQPIIISIWNRNSKPNGADRFLGAVHINNVSDLKNAYTLQKRSNRSHVSGTLVVETIVVTQDNWKEVLATPHVTKCFPFDVYSTFTELAKKAYKFDYELSVENRASGLEGLLSQSTAAVINAIGGVWQITGGFKCLLDFDNSVLMFMRGFCTISGIMNNTLKDACEFSADVQSLSDQEEVMFHNTASLFKKILEERVVNFILKNKGSCICGSDFDVYSQILVILFNNPMINRNASRGSASIYFRTMMKVL